MPTLIDTNEMRTLVDSVDKQFKPVMAITRLFFAEGIPSKTKKIQYKLRSGRRIAASANARGTEAEKLNRAGYENREVNPAYIKMSDVITPSEHDSTEFEQAASIVEQNEDFVDGYTQRILESGMEMLDATMRKIELMAIEAVRLGKVTYNNGTIEDFGRDANHRVLKTGTGVWSASATADPIADLKSMRRNIIRNGGKNPDIVVMGSTASANFLKCTSVEKYFDNRRYNIGDIDPVVEVQAPGLIYVGRIKELGVDIYEYDDVYKDATGTTQVMFPADEVVMGTAAVKRDAVVEYARLDLKENVDQKWTLKEYEEKENTELELHSAPLPVTKNADAFGSIKTEV